jgi:hypothetical protein
LNTEPGGGATRLGTTHNVQVSFGVGIRF